MMPKNSADHPRQSANPMLNSAKRQSAHTNTNHHRLIGFNS